MWSNLSYSQISAAREGHSAIKCPRLRTKSGRRLFISCRRKPSQTTILYLKLTNYLFRPRGGRAGGGDARWFKKHIDNQSAWLNTVQSLMH